MARPRAADYDAKRQLIRDRAAELFAARGFAATSIADIARACDVTKSLVYHYFRAKDDILYDLLAEHVGRLEREARDAVAAAHDPKSRFRAFIAAHVLLYVDAREKHALLLNALGALSAARRRKIVALQRQLVALARELCAALAPALRSDRARATAVAMSVYGLINWMHTWYRPGGAIDPRAYAELAAGLLLDGLAVRQARS
jgi:AcrR family transcriptional regulator